MKKVNHFETEKWKEWIEAVFWELHYLSEIRIIYKNIEKIINSNKEVFGDTFRFWLRSNYRTCALFVIRRLVDKDERTFSLILLLKDIQAYHSLINREGYVQMIVESYRKDPRYGRYLKKKERQADKQFTKWVGRDDFLNPFIVEKDIEEIKSVSADIKKYVNRYLAHNQKNKKTKRYLLNIDKCLRVFTKIFRKYSMLITGISYHFEPSEEFIKNEIEEIFGKKLNVDIK